CRYTLADRTQADRVCAVLSRRVERIAEGHRPGRAEDDSKLAIANRPVGSRNSATPRTEIPAAHPPLKVDRNRARNVRRNPWRNCRTWSRVAPRRSCKLHARNGASCPGGGTPRGSAPCRLAESTHSPIHPS